MHAVRSFVPHPDHVPYSWINDFALLELQQPVQWAPNVQPIVLASHPNDLLPDGDCIVTGWGRTLNDSQSIEQLRAVNVPLVPHELCARAYEGKIDHTMVCAGDLENGGKGSCTYDSGGPLVCAGVQVGIASWGKGCAMPGYPDVYSSVLYAKSWIDSVVQAGKSQTTP